MRHTKPRRLELGSVSHATMREEDLIPRFVDVADGLRLTRDDRKRLAEIKRRMDEEAYFEGEEAVEDCQDLFDLLDRYTPDYCYFGAHPGDGSDYGVWVTEELFDDRHQGGFDGCVWRLRENQSPAEAKIETTYTHAIAVSDHGNATLYRRVGRQNRWIEVWAVV